MGLLKDIDQQARPVDKVDSIIKEMMDPSNDLERIVDHYRDSDLDDDALRDALGNDFEMLEYDPEEVEGLVGSALQMLGRG